MPNVVSLPGASSRPTEQSISVTFDKGWALIDAVVPTHVAEELLRLSKQPKKKEPKQLHAYVWLLVLLAMWLLPSPVKVQVTSEAAASACRLANGLANGPVTR
jgi:hypothetical protein